MDKTDILDEMWFTGDRMTKKGDEVIAAITKYKNDIKGVLGGDVKYNKAKLEYKCFSLFSDSYLE